MNDKLGENNFAIFNNKGFPEEYIQINKKYRKLVKG